MPSVSAEPTFESRRVLTPALISQITDTSLDDGELAFIVSLGQYFRLDKQSTEPLSVNHVLPSHSSSNGILPGRWKPFVQDGGSGTIVYEPGTPNPSGNVFATWQEAYNASIASPGINILEISNAFQNPAVIPAGVYDLHEITLSGNIQTFDKIDVSLEDGVVFSRMGEITNKLLLTSFATTVPVHVVHENDFIITNRGAQICSDSTATQPFFLVPPLTNTPLFVNLTGGGVRGPGIAISVQAGASFGMILDTFARLDDNVIAGAGNGQVIVSSQSAFVNSPFPISQPGLAGLNTVIFSYAGFTQFQNLNPGPWAAPPPTNVEDAINRMAALLQTLNGGTPIP